jgi:hypothetical protein
VFFTGTTGYRASYVTTYRTGDYGIYAFDSTKGQIDNSHTVGSRDGGVYIGQCFPCEALIYKVMSEHNGLGYSGTNSGGSLQIVSSTFRNNRAGIVPNSGSYELCYPSRETTIVGNLVYSNNQTDTPAIDVALLAQGNGILIAGGVRADIERNRVYDHNRTGIGLVPYLEEDPNDDLPTPGGVGHALRRAEERDPGDAEPARCSGTRTRTRSSAMPSATAVRPISPSRPPAKTSRRSATASPTTRSPRPRRSTCRRWRRVKAAAAAAIGPPAT